MEGSRRGAALAAMVLVVVALTAGASGCGDDESSAVGAGAVRTAHPERVFAPMVELPADEPWRPMSARWFIERSVLWFAEDRGCEDRKVAVGRTLPEQQNPTTDWIYIWGLGSGDVYFRNPFGAKCALNFDVRAYADQLTRPHDPGNRIEGVRPGQGFYLDLVDDARIGPGMDGVVNAPVYFERADEGDSRVRLTYWMLYGMHGMPGQANVHEGDWKRVDVLLSADGDRYEPVAVQVVSDGSSDAGEAADVRNVAWSTVQRADGTHPVVRAARATHTMEAMPTGSGCVGCAAWETWRSLAEARDQQWYGFGGPWGQPGTTSATTGPLGPHRFWPNAAEKAREAYGR